MDLGARGNVTDRIQCILSGPRLVYLGQGEIHRYVKIIYLYYNFVNGLNLRWRFGDLGELLHELSTSSK